MFFNKINEKNNIHNSNTLPAKTYYKNKQDISIFEGTLNVPTTESNLGQISKQKRNNSEEDKTYSLLLERIKNDAKEVELSCNDSSEIDKIRYLIRGAALSLCNLGVKQLTFDDIKQYLEESTRTNELQNAFDFLDIMDNYNKEDNKVEFLFQKDSTINLEELSNSLNVLTNVIFGQGNEIISDEVLGWKNKLKLNFDKKDLETILFTLYAKAQDEINNAPIYDGEIIKEENGNKIIETWNDGNLKTKIINGEIIYEDKCDDDGNGEIFKLENGNKIVETWIDNTKMKESINGELVYEVREIDGIVEVYRKNTYTGAVTIEKYKDGRKIIEN